MIHFGIIRWIRMSYHLTKLIFKEYVMLKANLKAFKLVKNIAHGIE
jgi:hypothetical protein|tara:strand:- start:1468 stop:1605 length:138 start_codon:yes stop_codon:yes gene_type:complete